MYLMLHDTYRLLSRFFVAFALIALRRKRVTKKTASSSTRGPREAVQKRAVGSFGRSCVFVKLKPIAREREPLWNL